MVAAATDQGLCLLEFADRPELERELHFLRKHLAAESVADSEHKILRQIQTELREFFAGQRRVFETRLHQPFIGTEFQQSIWTALREIPCGETRTYKQLAEMIRKPTAVRAVGAANGANRMAVIVPCHRVIGSDGSLTGYAGGLERKKRLLELEGLVIDSPGADASQPGLGF